MSHITPLSKFLLTVDCQERAQKEAALAAFMASSLGKRVQVVELLHVMAGRYLSQHMANIDFRVDHVLDSDTFKRLRQDHIDKEITPCLEELGNRFQETGITPVTKVKDGRPAEVITAEARDGNFSTIFMEPRTDGGTGRIIMGSVTMGVLQSSPSASVYLAGESVYSAAHKVVTKVVVALDGSPESLRACGESAVLCAALGEDLEAVTLVHVLDLATYPGDDHEAKPGAQAEGVVQEARDILSSKEVPEEKIKEVINYGDPVSIIQEIAQKEKTDLIYMGRKGRSAIKDLIVGGVSTGLIQKCQGPSLAIVP